MFVNSSQYSSDSLYVPVHKRSTSASSVTRASRKSSWRMRDTDDEHLEATPPKRLMYSIHDMLQLSSSPLARLSSEQLHAVHEHLHLPLASVHSKAQRASSPAKTAPVIVNTVVAVRGTKQNTTERPRRVRRSMGSPAEHGNKHRNGWGYGVHASSVQGDWRHSIVPALGA